MTVNVRNLNRRSILRPALSNRSLYSGRDRSLPPKSEKVLHVMVLPMSGIADCWSGICSDGGLIDRGGIIEGLELSTSLITIFDPGVLRMASVICLRRSCTRSSSYSWLPYVSQAARSSVDAYRTPLMYHTSAFDALGLK